MANSLPRLSTCGRETAPKKDTKKDTRGLVLLWSAGAFSSQPPMSFFIFLCNGLAPAAGVGAPKKDNQFGAVLLCGFVLLWRGEDERAMTMSERRESGPMACARPAETSSRVSLRW